MPRIIVILTTFLTLFLSFTAYSKLVPGDVILIPQKCYLCGVIRSETEGPFSHAGIIVKNKRGELLVAEALDKVRVTRLAEFLNRPQYEDGEIKIIRPYFLSARERSTVSPIFWMQFYGLPYDHEFLWDNKTPQKRDKIYCSELIAKLLNRAAGYQVISPVPMTFNKNWNIWKQYFNGNIPQGKLGLSPNDLWRSRNFTEVLL